MRPAHLPPFGGAYSRRFAAYTGIFFDEFATDSAWVREAGTVRLPPVEAGALVLRGEIRPHPAARGFETAAPGLRVLVNGQPTGELLPAAPGPWSLRVAVPAAREITLTLALTGVGFGNFLAWLGRVTGLGPWQRFRAQNKNRQLRLATIATDDGEIIFDFSRRDAPFSPAYVRRHARLGMNIAGFLAADLGVGESARCMVRAADAAGIATALVPLKLHCKNRQGDDTYRARFQDDNPHPVNVVHIDPPAARDLDHHHGAGFRAGKYNIGYFAWELPEFPDAWVPSFDYFDEIWCPSEFTAAAVALKSPVPVLTMPHAIAFDRPAPPVAALRAHFALPPRAFVFLTLFDLNSYSARKNPRAAIEAFRLAALPPPAGDQPGAALAIKVQNVAGNEADFAALQQSVRDLPGVVLLTETLPRADITALEAACDCFVSLHRSEGFGLAIAEAMFLGKPAISTAWSAPAEFVDDTNGCPVRARLVTLEQSHGPYARGATWAEPDVAHAAEHMRRLFGDPALAARLGAAAQRTIETRFSPPTIGQRYRRRLEAIAAF
jgi:glycosyltransferase involved in cell wall biosynthesis